VTPPMSSIEIVGLIMSAVVFLVIVGGLAFIVWDSLRSLARAIIMANMTTFDTLARMYLGFE